MEAVLERRVASAPRVRLDALVELSHEGFEETFEADAVNLGVGGLSMRATYLPDVGERLTCRFPVPGVSGRFEAGAEVVWCEDTGPHTGEFGLRFVGLDPMAERALKLVVLGTDGYTPPAPSGTDKTADKTTEDTLDETPLSEEVVLSIDGVRSPIRAGLVDGDDDVMSLAQELPFLRLRTGVTVQKDGRRGRIEAIDLVVEDDLPKLLIDIVFEETGVQALHGTAEETLADLLPPKVVANDTSVDLLAPQDPPRSTSAPSATPRIVDVIRPPSAIAAAAAAAAATASEYEDLDDEDDDAGFVDDGATREGRDDVRVFAIEARSGAASINTTVGADAEMAALSLDGTDTTAMRLRAHLVAMIARGRPYVTRMRARLVPVLMRILPALAALTKRAKPLAATLGARIRPMIEATTERVLRFGRTARVFVGERFPRLAQKSVKRRTTTAPPGDSNVAARRRGPRASKVVAEVPHASNRKRTILVSVVAFVAVGALVYAWSGDAEPAVDSSAQSIADRVVAEPAPSSEPLGAQSSEVGAAPPIHTSATAPTFPPSGSATVTPSAPTVVEPAMPRALAPATLQAGPMPAPTFPSLREGAQPSAPSVLPPSSPYAVDVRQAEGVGATTTTATGANAPTTANPATGASEFGAANVPDGRSYLIRMSQPVHAISGTANANGFTIVVANALSLDRAGPIAATHPLVERSMILNRGDHSELTIEFVEGRTPTYAVRARGSAVEVVIGRR